jgi:hypothetical protein
MYIYSLRQGVIRQVSSCYDKISDLLKQFLKIKKRLQYMQTPRGGNLSKVLSVAIERKQIENEWSELIAKVRAEFEKKYPT